MEIFFAYSPWFIALCLLLAAGLTYLFYFWRNNSDNPLNKWQQRLLSTFRFVVLFILAVFLLEPFIKSLTTKVEKPSVLVAIDQSQSMLLAKDSTFNKNNLKASIAQLSKSLGDEYQVKILGFGAQSFPLENYNYQEKVSDLSGLVEELGEKYASNNLGAVILASDGISNRGNNPIFAAEQLKAPIYTIALGDTTPVIDLAIQSVKTNKLAYLNNQFPVLTALRATRLKGKTATLNLSKNGKIVASQNINIDSDNFSKEVQLTAKAEQVGIQSYQLTLSTFPNEISKSNNAQTVFVEVIETRQKIALIYNQLHPDIAAIRQSIEANANYEVSVQELSSPEGNLAVFDMLILHLSGPLDGNKKNQLNNLLKSGRPSLLCLGANTEWSTINAANLGIRLNGNGGLNQVQGKLNDAFQLFAYDGLSSGDLTELPPLSAAFGDYQLSPVWNSLMFQQLDRLSTSIPLFAFSEVNGLHRAVILGEGLWRWRMACYAKFQSHERFDLMFNKTVQYLTANANRKNFLVNYKKQLDESEEAIFSAELYNAAFDFVPGQEIQLKLNKDDSLSFDYAFAKGSNSYDLSIKNLLPGKYNFVATTNLAGKNLVEKGSFFVSPIQLEAANTVADHQLLLQLAAATQGKMVTRDAIQSLVDLIKANPSVKATSYTTSNLNEAIKLKWIFALLILFLTVEWLIRKRSGLY